MHKLQSSLDISIKEFERDKVRSPESVVWHKMDKTPEKIYQKPEMHSSAKTTDELIDGLNI